MKRFKPQILLSLFCLVIGSFLPVAAEDLRIADDSITVAGQGFIEAQPDIVDLNFELFAVAPTLQKAKQEVDQSYQSALAAIKLFKIPNSDIQLTQINSRAEYEWQDRSRVFKGQRVSRTLRVTIRDVGIYPKLLESLVDSSISEVSSIHTRFSDRASLEQKALAIAVSAAKQKAGFLAAQFGRELANVIHIAESQMHRPLPMQPQLQRGAMMSDEDGGQSLPPALFGLQRINAKLTVVYRLK